MLMFQYNVCIYFYCGDDMRFLLIPVILLVIILLVILAAYEGDTLSDVCVETKELTAGHNSIETKSIVCNEACDRTRFFVWQATGGCPVSGAYTLYRQSTGIEKFSITLGSNIYEGDIDNINKRITVDVEAFVNTDGVLTSASSELGNIYELLKAISPTIELSEGCVLKENKLPRDFNLPQKYTVVHRNGEQIEYDVAVEVSACLREFDFTHKNLALVNPSTALYGNTTTRHGAPGPDGTLRGGGIWQLTNFAYCFENGEYVLTEGEYVRDTQKSYGYIAKQSAPNSNEDGIRFVKDKQGGVFELYSSGGAAPDRFVDKTITDVSFRINDVAGSFDVRFGGGNFMMRLDACSDGYDLKFGSGNNLISTGIVLNADEWYSARCVIHSRDDLCEVGELYVDGEFAASRAWMPRYVTNLNKCHTSFFADEDSLCDISLSYWGIAYIKGEEDSDVKEAYEKLIESYSSSSLDLLASLYDPDRGGFYYSISARDYQYDTLLPDLESTGQVLNFIDCVRWGQQKTHYSDSVLYAADTTDKIIGFVQGMRDPTDGYFYHPQWGSDITASRLGRDKGYAEGILKRFGVTQTVNLMQSGEVSVCSASDNESADMADVFNNQESFVCWLDSLSWDTNAWDAGNNVASFTSQVIDAGFSEVCADYILEKQNKETGLWGSGVNSISVGGAMKLARVLKLIKVPYPNADKAVRSIVPLLLEDTQPQSITHLYNLWDTLASIRQTLGNEIPVEYQTVLFSNAASMIQKTIAKLEAFKKPDGGYSYCTDYSPAFSQDAHVALGVSESDVNATTIAIGDISSSVRAALDLDNSIAYFTSEDFERFKEAIASAPSCPKQPKPDEVKE